MTTANKSSMNMGMVDRFIRGGLGFLLLTQGLKMNPHKSSLGQLEMLGGAGLLIAGMTGFDPLMNLFGVNTKVKDSNNILNVIIKNKLPGQGIKPSLTEQPLPVHIHKNRNFNQKVKEQFAIL